MYGGLPTSYNPRASLHDVTAEAVSRLAPAGFDAMAEAVRSLRTIKPSGFNPELKAALDAKTIANSPWPLARPAPAAVTAPAPAADYDNSRAPAEYTGQPLRRVIGRMASGEPVLGETFESEKAAAIAEAGEFVTAESARIRSEKPAADILAFAGRLEAKAVALRLEAAEALRRERLESDQAGWLTAEAEARQGIAAEALEAEAAEAEAESARIAAEAREAVAKPEQSGQAEAEAREAVRLDGYLTGRYEKAKTAEAGERIKLTAILPADMRKPEHRETLAVLEFDLTLQFGGYTVSKARGGWLDGSGDLVRDSSQVYSCSFDPAEREADKAEAKLIGYFVAAGEALGEEWLHIERSTFTACHRKAS